MRNTALTAIPVPNLDDPPNVPLHLGTVADQMETFAIPRFTNKAALDAAWGTAPDGARAYTITDGITWVRIAGVWKGGWQSFSPSIYNGAQQVPANVTYCQFQNVNGLVTYQGELVVTGTGALAQIGWTLPRGCTNPNGAVVGTATLYQASSNTYLGHVASFNGLSLLYLRQVGGPPGITTPLAPNDALEWSVIYRTTQLG
jgi:hypothetical protein